MPEQDPNKTNKQTPEEEEELRTKPSQAEGARNPSPPTPDLATRDQAEGERSDVEETLRQQEKAGQHKREDE